MKRFLAWVPSCMSTPRAVGFIRASFDNVFVRTCRRLYTPWP